MFHSFFPHKKKYISRGAETSIHGPDPSAGAPAEIATSPAGVPPHQHALLKTTSARELSIRFYPALNTQRRVSESERETKLSSYAVMGVDGLGVLMTLPETIGIDDDEPAAAAAAAAAADTKLGSTPAPADAGLGEVREAAEGGAAAVVVVEGGGEREDDDDDDPFARGDCTAENIELPALAALIPGLYGLDVGVTAGDG